MGLSLNQKCPDVGQHGGLEPIDPKKETIIVKGFAEQKFATNNPLHISAYFRITDIPANSKEIELINAVVMQYGSTGKKTKDVSLAKKYQDEDKEDAKIGYSRPVRFRVWYDVKAKQILAAAYIYNEFTFKKGGDRNNKFKITKNYKIVQLPRQVLFGNFVFGGKTKKGFNMTNKWFFVGIKVLTALKKLRYSNGKVSPPAYWVATTEAKSEERGHNLDNLLVKRNRNYMRTDAKFGPRGGLCECPDGSRYYVGEEEKSRKVTNLKDVKFGCKGGKIVERFAKPETRWNQKTMECESPKLFGWWAKRMSDYPGLSSTENPDRFRFSTVRNMKYYYAVAGDTYKSFTEWHKDKTKAAKSGTTKFKGAFLGYVWGASASSHLIERYHHSNQLVYFRPNALTRNNDGGNVVQSNWFASANVKITRIHKNAMYDSVENLNIAQKDRVNGFFIDSNQTPSDVTATNRTVYGEVIYRIPNFFKKGKNFRTSEFNKMLSDRYHPRKRKPWLNNSNWSNHLDLRRHLRVYRMQLGKGKPLIDVNFHFDMDSYKNKALNKDMFEERLKFNSIMKFYTKRNSHWRWSAHHNNYGGPKPQMPNNYMRPEGYLPYRFWISISPNHHWPTHYAYWNNDRHSGLKYNWHDIGEIKFKDSFGSNQHTYITSYDKWFNEKVQHILTDESNQMDINYFKPFMIEWRSFQVSNDSSFSNPALCDTNKDRGHNDVNGHTSACGVNFNNGQFSYFALANKSKYTTFCLKESNKGDEFLKDSHGWKGCVKTGQVYDAKQDMCVDKIPNCSQMDKTQRICLACKNGYEKYVEMDGLFKPKRWYLEKKQLSHWEKAFQTKDMVQCKICDEKYIYNSITRECHKAVKEIALNYKSSHHGRYHWFQGMKVPKAPKNKHNKGMVKIWLELHLDTKKPLDNIPVVETHIYFRKPVKAGKCLETKKGTPFRSVHDSDQVGKRKTYTEYNRAFFDLQKNFEAKGGGTYYYMNWSQMVPAGTELQVRATIYGHKRDEATYFVKAFKYRFDQKDATGKWNHYGKQKSAVSLKKLYFYNKDKVIKTVPKTGLDTDYDFSMVEVGRYKKIPND